MATKKERHQSKTGKKSSFPLFGILGVIVVAIAAGAWYYAKPTSDSAATVGSISDRTEVQGDWGMGNPDAKLTIIEYGDFQCPACGFYHPIVKELMEEFKDDVYFIFRHFPLVNAHQFATMAASASEAAGRQGKFWEMHDLLMTNQQMWSRGMASSAFLAYARELGLNDVQFQQDVRDEAIFAKIEKDFNSGVDLKINSVPSFFFNGTYTSTPRTKEAFRQLIIDKLMEAEAAE
jgi:protein-disulfide isomerase